MSSRIRRSSPRAIEQTVLLVALALQSCADGSPRDSSSAASDASITRQSAARPGQPGYAVAASSAPPQTVTVTGAPEACEPSLPDPNAVVPPSVISRKDPVIPKDVEVRTLDPLRWTGRRDLLRRGQTRASATDMASATVLEDAVHNPRKIRSLSVTLVMGKGSGLTKRRPVAPDFTA